MKPLIATFKKWLIYCLVFGFVIYLIEMLYWTPMVAYNRSQGGADYGLDSRGLIFLFFGAFLNLIVFGLVGFREFLKAKQE